jgi:hypothetical protein
MTESKLERNDTTPAANSNMHNWHCYSRNYNRCWGERCTQYNKASVKTNRPSKLV